MELKPIFGKQGSLVFCDKISKIIQYLDDANKWKLFIDYSQKSLKNVLLHNGNQLTSIPIAHSVHLKETYEY